MEDSSVTRECKRSSVADASSSSGSASSSKRRKVGFPVVGEAEVDSSCSELASRALPAGFTEKVKVEVQSPAAPFLCLASSNFSSDRPALSPPLSSFDSSDVVEERLLVGDHQEDSLGTETSTCINGDFRESTPPSELCHDCEKDSEKMEQQQLPTNNRRTQEPAAARNRMTPPQAEIEEFFSAAEKYEQKQFTEKYNYDVVKDVPLQGRYQWVRLKP